MTNPSPSYFKKCWIMLVIGIVIGAAFMYTMHATCMLSTTSYTKCADCADTTPIDVGGKSGKAHMICAGCDTTDPSGPSAGLKIPYTDTAAYILAFRDNVNMVDATTPLTIGGRLHRCVVEATLASLPAGEEYMNYRFGYDMDHKKIILMIMGGPDFTGTDDHQLIFRTGTAEDCWCPNFCR